MNAEPQRTQEQDARSQWCGMQTLGRDQASFFPGDAIRCPATRQTREGRSVVCGSWLRMWVKPMQQVMVRKWRPRPFIALSTPEATQGSAGLDVQCPSCPARLEVFPLLEVRG